MFKKILIANRGEIAIRIHRTCREMGIATVAVHSEADTDALHVKMANEAVCIGGNTIKDSYLNIPAILAAAEITDAEAIHPGYGFLSENERFAEIVTKLGFTFIGPKPEHINVMGDKISALKYAKELGLPTIPGSGGELESVEDALSFAEKVGYPVILKASAGGGGRGMKVAHSESALRTAYNVAKSEAQSVYGDNRIYLEKYLQKPRHIEVQVLADAHKNIHILGERDCSLQRRHQKVVEETPSPALTPQLREKLFATCHKVMQKMGYLGAGTIEFLYQDGNFYFIEMNTRLQVEHPITECVTDTDLVREQIRIAAGEELRDKNKILSARGHSIEVRINAEDPDRNFAPCPGEITDYFPPGGPGVRIDSSIYQGYKVPPYYDANIAKLIIHGKTRAEAVARLQRALEEFIIGGITTNINLLRTIVSTPEFKSGEYTIHSLEHFINEGSMTV